MKTPKFVADHLRFSGLGYRKPPFRVRIKRGCLGFLMRSAVPREIASLIIGRTLWALTSQSGNSTLVFPPPNKSIWKRSPWYINEGTFKRVKQ